MGASAAFPAGQLGWGSGWMEGMPCLPWLACASHNGCSSHVCLCRCECPTQQLAASHGSESPLTSSSQPLPPSQDCVWCQCHRRVNLASLQQSAPVSGPQTETEAGRRVSVGGTDPCGCVHARVTGQRPGLC